MSALGDLVSKSSESAAAAAQKIKKRPLVTSGVVLLALGAVGLYMMWPEIHRYVRMKRM